MMSFKTKPLRPLPYETYNKSACKNYIATGVLFEY